MNKRNVIEESDLVQDLSAAAPDERPTSAELAQLIWTRIRNRLPGEEIVP